MLALTLLFSIGVMTWVSNGVNAQRANPPAGSDALLTQVQQLEQKIEQLQKEMAGAKLVVTGLDKSLTNLKSAYAAHTHKLVAASYTFDQYRIESANGKALYAPITTMDALKQNKGFLTTPPIP